MIKLLKTFLSSILITSFTVTGTTMLDNLTSHQLFLAPSRALYQNIDASFANYNADVKQALAGANGSHTGGTGKIFSWNQYAHSWDEFKANYGGLNLTVNMNIAFNWYNIKWQNTNLYIPLGNITVNSTKWIKITQVDQTTTQGGRWDSTHAVLEYDCWVSNTDVLIRFQLRSWASNNYDNYYYTIDTRHISCNTTFDYNSIKEKFNRNVNNKKLNLESNFSSSLLNEKNKATSKKELDQLIKNGLGEYYDVWKEYIAPYSYDDVTNQATITVKFTDPNKTSNNNILWEFKVVIKYTLSQGYWDKEFQERLEIKPGTVIDPNNPNGKMIEDQPLKWQGQNVYGTTAEIIFNGAADGSETMKVNGVPIQVIDNKFRFKMTDNQEHETNEYTILLEKHDLNDFDKILGSYEFNYLIKQDIPNLDLKWYAWNPAANPDQKSLIEPTLPNGEINPNYDREVNPKTGTKTEIVWVKHPAEKPFPLDPLNKAGDIITNGIYDQGFLTEGSVSGMGINQTFNDPWIKTVQRVRVDAQTLKPISAWENIKSDKEGQHFSKSGTYLYLITDQKGMTSNKFIIIGQQWQDKYAKFLDVLNNPATAVPFWSTMQGFHLKNYLVKYKQLNSANIQNLTFEQVASYWKEYVSDVQTQKVGPGVNPGNQIILNHLNLEDIKMNQANLADIKDEILSGANGIIKQLNKYQLEYNVDYQIIDLELKAKELLDGYHNSGQAVVKLTIKALDTSTKASGMSNPIQVRNSKAYDPDNAVDLAKINFDAYRYNFSRFTTEQLKEWILKAIDKKFQSLNFQLVYQVDYHVSSLTDDILKQFISAKEVTKLEVIIKAEIMSDHAKNNTSLTLINDPDGDIAPPDPPDLKPDPDIKPIVPDDNSWISQKQNLIIMTVATILIVAGSGTFIFFKYRLKKGIGGKKIKK